jgi:hypothetical protein
MTRFFIYSAIIILTESCSSVTPSAFWKNFDSKTLTKEISDQGPYGGHRALYWQTSMPNYFSSTEIISFANKNSWTLVDSSKLTGQQIEKWKFYNKYLFPLSSSVFVSTDTIYNSQFDNFPLQIKGDITLYKFETGWTKVNLRTAETTNAFGYVLLNNDKTQMTVYYLWGE